MQVDFKTQSSRNILGCLSAMNNKLDHFVSLESTLPGVITTLTRIMPLYSIIILDALIGAKQAITWKNSDTDPAIISSAIRNADKTFHYFLHSNGVNPKTFSSELVESSIHGISDNLTLQVDPKKGFLVALPLVTSHSSVFGIIQLSCTESINEGKLGLCNIFAYQISRAMEKNFITPNLPMSL
ncbi:MAG: hypothetical protein H7249_12090 [Chitinophagaceae bacterium]|nr:hypothetical protein [Oligoflexus sp.]